MLEIKIFAFLARYSNYRDYDRMVSLFSAENGRIDAIARSCRRPKSVLMSATQPFVYAEYVLRQKSNRWSITQANVHESFYNIRLDYNKLQISSTIMEACLAAASPGEPCQALFQLAYYCLSFLCYADKNPEDVLVCFLAKFLDNQGYRPASTKCAYCSKSTFIKARFNRMNGALCQYCGLKHGGQLISALSLEALRRMINMPLNQMDQVVLPNNVRNELLNGLVSFFQSHIEGNFHSAILSESNTLDK